MTWYTNCCIPFLHFNSKQRNKFLYFCSTIVNIVFSFINISTLQMVTSRLWKHRVQSTPGLKIFFFFHQRKFSTTADHFFFPQHIQHYGGRKELIISRRSELHNSSCSIFQHKQTKHLAPALVRNVTTSNDAHPNGYIHILKYTQLCVYIYIYIYIYICEWVCINMCIFLNRINLHMEFCSKFSNTENV